MVRNFRSVVTPSGPSRITVDQEWTRGTSRTMVLGSGPGEPAGPWCWIVDQEHQQDHGAELWTSGLHDHLGPLKNIFLIRKNLCDRFIKWKKEIRAIYMVCGS